MKQKLGTSSIFVVSGFIPFHVFLAAPVFLYLTNASEFRISLLALLLYLLPASIVGFTLMFLACRRLANKGRFRLLASIAAVGLFLYLQFFMLVRDYGILDGRAIDWSTERAGGYLEIGLFTALLGLAIFFGRRFVSATSIALAILMLGEVFTVAAELSRYSAPDPQSAALPAIVGLEELSPLQNVIVFVVDTLQSDVFEELVQEDPRLSEGLAGFDFFRNTVGAFPYTHLSIQAILTGSYYEPGDSLADYRERLRFQYLTNRVSRSGGLVTYLGPSNNLEYLKGRRASIRYDLAQLYSVVLFRQAPHFLKPAILNDLLPRLSQVIAGPDMAVTVERDLETLRSLSSQSYVGDAQLTFKFFHLYGSHLPSWVGSDCDRLVEASYSRQEYKEQSRCVLSHVVDYLDMLRQRQVFDQSMIFLLSDHGSIFPLLPESANSGRISERVISSAHATIALKDFDSTTGFRVTDAPASLIDVAPTIVESLGMTASGEGRNLLSLAEDEIRTRRFFYFPSANDVLEGRVTRMDEFEVTGPSRQPAAWTLVRRHGNAEDDADMIDPGSEEIVPSGAGGGNVAPRAISVSPSSGNGTSQSFDFLYLDGNGHGDLAWVEMLIHGTLSGAGGCYMHYWPSTNELWLRNDEGTAWTTVTLGTGGTVENSQCQIVAASSSPTQSETNLSVNVAVTFKAGFTGVMDIYMRAQDQAGLGSGWQDRNDWTVVATIPN